MAIALSQSTLAEEIYYGFQQPGSGNSDANALSFQFKMLMGRVWTSMLVQVQSVTNAGELEPVGFCDVLPMVAQINGRGDATPHGIIHNLPYMRIQGGANAVIIDPQVGDIGLAIFAQRDISAVKASRQPNVPGSFRRFDPADGLYVGGFLNAVPQQYVRFSDAGVEIVSPTEVRLVAPSIILDGAVHATDNINVDGAVDAAGEVTGDGVALSTHTHGGVTTGSGNTGAPN